MAKDPGRANNNEATHMQNTFNFHGDFPTPVLLFTLSPRPDVPFPNFPNTAPVSTQQHSRSEANITSFSNPYLLPPYMVYYLLLLTPSLDFLG